MWSVLPRMNHFFSEIPFCTTIFDSFLSSICLMRYPCTTNLDTASWNWFSNPIIDYTVTSYSVGYPRIRACFCSVYEGVRLAHSNSKINSRVLFKNSIINSPFFRHTLCNIVNFASTVASNTAWNIIFSFSQILDAPFEFRTVAFQFWHTAIKIYAKVKSRFRSHFSSISCN